MPAPEVQIGNSGFMTRLVTDSDDLIVALIALTAFSSWPTNKWIGSIALVTVYGLAVYGSLWK
jgi:uncharacterized membrane protein YqjE